MELSGVEDLFNSPIDVSNYMGYPLSWSASQGLWEKRWVFWSQQDQELRSLLGSLYPSIDNSGSGNSAIAKKIKASLQRVRTFTFRGENLIQFWAPVQAGDKTYLTTADQAFAVSGFAGLHKGLCSYRKHCTLRLLVPVHINEISVGEEDILGPIARGFRRGLPESCNDVRDYSTQEYPLRDSAIACGITSCTVLPLFEAVGAQCIGILEILSTTRIEARVTYRIIEEAIKGMGLRIINEKLNYSDMSSIIRLGSILASAVIEDICQSHKLPFAQMWAATSNGRRVAKISGYRPGPYNWEAYDLSFNVSYTWEGEGVVGKAFASRSACFCNNVRELCISVCPSLPTARKLEVANCFAICLKNAIVRDLFYILELFLPRSREEYGDPTSFVNLLVTSLKMKIQKSSWGHCFEELGEKLFVEVIKTSSDGGLDSFELCGGSVQITKAKRNYSEFQSGYPFSNPQVDLGLHLSLHGSGISGVDSYSVVQSNSLPSVQEMSLGMRLDSLNGNGQYSLIQPNFPSSVQERILRLNPRQEAEDDSTSSLSVRNYTVVRPTPSISEPISSSDSDFSDINAFRQILRQ